MNKKKKYLKKFTNWLFEEYKVPRIPVRIMHDITHIIDKGDECYGYFGEDNGETVILVAAKRLGKTKCMFTIAHEFVHYMQMLSGRDMSNTESVERDAYTYEVPLVGKYIINHKHIGDPISTVLDITQERVTIERG